MEKNSALKVQHRIDLPFRHISFKLVATYCRTRLRVLRSRLMIRIRPKQISPNATDSRQSVTITTDQNCQAEAGHSNSLR
jgi:hypothetical protein